MCEELLQQLAGDMSDETEVIRVTVRCNTQSCRIFVGKKWSFINPMSYKSHQFTSCFYDFLWHLAGWFIQTHILGRFWLTRSHRITVFCVLMVFCEDKPKKKEAEAGPPQSTAWWSPHFSPVSPLGNQTELCQLTIQILVVNDLWLPVRWKTVTGFTPEPFQQGQWRDGETGTDEDVSWAFHGSGTSDGEFFHGERRKSDGRLGIKTVRFVGVSHSVQRVGRWADYMVIPRDFVPRLK